MAAVGYFSYLRQSSGNHAPKCLPFSILCAKSVIIHTSITYKLIKTDVGVNCNSSWKDGIKSMIIIAILIELWYYKIVILSAC